ncbi:MAG: hypothetical protein HYZ42_18720 [Bacteroidetes bacterium]|nr:hypothetical protein [Bacteroidota bacterium]
MVFNSGLITLIVTFFSSIKTIFGISLLTTIIYFIIFFLLVIPLIYLYKSIRFFKDYFVTNDKETLNDAVHNERRYWEISGIYAVLIFIIFALGLVFGGVSLLLSFLKK